MRLFSGGVQYRAAVAVACTLITAYIIPSAQPSGAITVMRILILCKEDVFLKTPILKEDF